MMALMVTLCLISPCWTKTFKTSRSRYYQLHVNFAQAALGDEVDVPTVHGVSEIKVPAGTQSGTIS